MIVGPAGAHRQRRRGDPAARLLLAATPAGRIPEIPSEKTAFKAMLDELPKLVEKFSSFEDQASKVVERR
jgi:hypothetical protein